MFTISTFVTTNMENNKLFTFHFILNVIRGDLQVEEPLVLNDLFVEQEVDIFIQIGYL